MRMGRTGHRIKALGTVAAALAAVLLVGPQTAAGAPLADRSCTVTNLWSCKTAPPLWFNSGSVAHLYTVGVPPTSSGTFLLVVPTANPNGAYRVPHGGDAQEHFVSNLPAGNYVFELHCPHSCQGATLYVTRY